MRGRENWSVMATWSTWSVWRMARVAASLVVLMVASYYFVVAFDNITNPVNPNASNWPFVRGVISGDGVPADSGFGWRFIDATWFQALCYVGVVAAECITCTLLIIASVKGLRASSTAALWGHAQKWSIAGGIVGLALFFFGFMVVGGNWFIMYLNSKWNALEPAFWSAVMTMFMVLLVIGVMIGGQLARDEEMTAGG